MALPVLSTPKFELTLPSTKKKYKYRPFLAKEEKLLLMALEGGDQKETLDVVRDIINVCVEKLEVANLPMFDLEYVFLKLREKSIGETITFYVTHKEGINSKGIECTHKETVTVNLSDVNVFFSDDHTNKIMLDDHIGVCMKYPTIEMVEKFESLGDDPNSIFEMIRISIDYIFDSEKVYPVSDETVEAVNSFVDSMSHVQLEKVQKFFSTMPKLTYTVKWKCSKCGEEDSMVLEGLSSFFM